MFATGGGKVHDLIFTHFLFNNGSATESQVRSERNKIQEVGLMRSDN